MSHLFDPGYSAEPFCTLCAEYPEADVYPQASFALSGDQSSIAVASTVQRAWLPARFLPFQTDRLVGEIHHVRCAPASSVRVFCSAEGRLGIGIAEKIEDELANYAAIAECKAVAMLGIAHGWAGFLYALMQWKRTQGKEPGDGIRARLQQLEELGEERGTLLRTARISAKWIIPVIESRKSDFPSLGSVKHVLSSHRSCRTDLRASGIRVGAIKIGRRGIPDGALTGYSSHAWNVSTYLPGF